MSGSRLGRGRGGRLAVYGGCGVVVVLLVFLYRAASSEMTKLRELHVQCAHQQEALAAQLQVIFEYKVRLEKSLAEEKSSNAAIKQELQQRATREKSLRDKDSIEAMQRYNSLQQTYKMLQTEHQDLQEECKKREKQALEDSSRLEKTLQDLRSHVRQGRQDKEKALEHLKNKYLELDNEKIKFEEKYNEMVRNNKNVNSTIDHLKKEVFQLKRELEETKKSCKSTSPGPSLASPQVSQQAAQIFERSGNAQSAIGPPMPLQQQQQSTTSNSMREIPALKYVSSTKPAEIRASTSSDKRSPPMRPILKQKLPVGVPPIPRMIESNENLEKPKQSDAKKKNEVEQNSEVKSNLVDTGSKEKEQVAGNVDGKYPPGKYVGEQIAGKRDGYFEVQPGVQEVGDVNHLGRIHGLDEGAERHGDDAAEYDYEKEPQQKNNDLHLVEGGDEVEDEDDLLD